MGGHVVEVAHRPNFTSVSECKEYTRNQAPNKKLHNKAFQDDTECTCCGQTAPVQASAMLKVEELTPTTVDLQQKQGEVIWICADCFSHGVRPKYVKFGDIKWNKEGRKIKKRAERATGVLWG